MQIQGETSVNKLIILFVFDKMESALSERTIVEMCTTSNGWLNYMDCVELLPKLLEDGFICRLSSDEEPLYSITTDGRESLNNFYINIPKSIRDEISAFVKKNSGKTQKPAGMQGGLLPEQGRHLHRLSQNHRARAAHAGTEIRRPRQENRSEYL